MLSWWVSAFSPSLFAKFLIYYSWSYLLNRSRYHRCWCCKRMGSRSLYWIWWISHQPCPVFPCLCLPRSLYWWDGRNYRLFWRIVWLLSLYPLAVYRLSCWHVWLTTKCIIHRKLCEYRRDVPFNRCQRRDTWSVGADSSMVGTGVHLTDLVCPSRWEILLEQCDRIYSVINKHDAHLLPWYGSSYWSQELYRWIFCICWIHSRFPQ